MQWRKRSGNDRCDSLSDRCLQYCFVRETKNRRVALVNIGDQTTSLSVFENGLLISINTFSIGSSDITNDIALGFKIPLERQRI